MLEMMETILKYLIDYGIVLFEMIGVILLFIGAVKACLSIAKEELAARITLFSYMSSALNFKLGAEILKTVTAQNIKEIGFIACVFLLRVAMTVLINYETKQLELEEQRETSKREKAS